MDRARPIDPNEGSAICLINTPAGLPLADSTHAIRLSAAFDTSDAPRPLRARDASELLVANTPSGLPIARRGSSVYGAIRNERDADAARPLPAHEGGSVVLANTPSGAPLALTPRAAATAAMVGKRQIARPLRPPEGSGIFTLNSPSGIPLGVLAARKAGRSKGAAVSSKLRDKITLPALQGTGRDAAADTLKKLTLAQLFDLAVDLGFTAAPGDSHRALDLDFAQFATKGVPKKWNKYANKKLFIKTMVEAIFGSDSDDDDHSNGSEESE
ncbi:hypothetical protein JCM10450v2_004902 [Rhodotorula kratochvilovae]